MTDFDVARDDLALDALAAGRLPEGADATLAALYALRTDLDGNVTPLRRRPRTLLVAVAAAVAGLVVGGVVVSSRPGQPFYATHRVVFGGTDHTKADAVTALLDRAAGRLARGDRVGARRVLAEAARLLPAVSGSDRMRLTARLRDLTALAAEPTPAPVPTPSRHEDHPSPSATPREQEHETPEPSHTEDESPSSDSHGGDDGSHSGPGG